MHVKSFTSTRNAVRFTDCDWEFIEFMSSAEMMKKHATRLDHIAASANKSGFIHWLSVQYFCDLHAVRWINRETRLNLTSLLDLYTWILNNAVLDIFRLTGQHVNTSTSSAGILMTISLIVLEYPYGRAGDIKLNNLFYFQS